MLPPPFANALVLTGPTGSGKSRLALELAPALGAEIVSMDSMTLYRGMDIGTAKPTTAERGAVRHHLIDVLDPWQSASVAWWLDQAAQCCRDIEARGKRVLFVGGTPLYLKALMFGLFEGPPANLELRKRLTREAETSGADALHTRLAAVDAKTAQRLHPNDVRRVIRALEVFELTGKPISAWQTQWSQKSEVRSQRSEVRDQKSDVSEGTDGDATPHSATTDLRPLTSDLCPLTSVLWLDLPRAELYERIDRRVEAMFAGGLVEEARRLRSLEKPLSAEAAQALGYREVFAHLDGHAGLEETIRLVQQRTRNLAKRQITWFRHLPYCRPATSELTWGLWQPKMGV